MKKILKPLCIALAILLIYAMPANAVEIGNSKASSFFAASRVSLSKTSDTTFEAWFQVSAVETMDELGASSITIQKSYDGVTWESMITYTKESTPKLICTNTGLHCECVRYAGTTGRYYRAKIVLYAKDGTSIGEMVEYTPTLQL